MTTQSLEFGYTTGQTLTATLFAIGSDTVVQTASSVTERTNAEGRYVAVFTDVTAGNYLLAYYLGGTGAGSEKYVLTLDTATFQPQSEKLTAEIAASVAAQADIAALIARFTGITSLLAILKKMIRSDFADATAESEIGGTYDDAADSLEAQGTVAAAIKAKTDTIAKGVYTVNSHFNPVTKALTLYQGDDYLKSNGRQTDIELSELTDVNLTNATAAVAAKGKYDKSLTITGTASVVVIGGVDFLRLEFPRAKISGTPGCYEYDAEVYDASTGAVVTTVVGELTLKESKTPLVS